MQALELFDAFLKPLNLLPYFHFSLFTFYFLLPLSRV